MANDVFLKKIYDKYLKTDFTYGDADLNPKREISLEEVSEGELSQKIEEKILFQFQALQEKANKVLKYQASDPKTLKSEKESEIGSLLGKANGKLKSGETYIKAKVGGHLPGLPDIDPGNPIIKEVDDTIKKIIPYLYPTGDTTKHTDGVGSPVLNEFDLPYSNMINCQIGYEDLTDPKASQQKDNDSELDNGNIDPSKCKNPECPNRYRTFTEEERLYISHHNGYCKTCYENPKLKHCEKCGAIIPPEKNTCTVCGKKTPEGENLNNDTNDNTGEEHDEIPCVMRELMTLKMFYILFKITDVGVKGISTILMSSVPLIKLISRCANCWVCPPSAGEAVQLVLDQVTSLVIDLLGTMLQMLWDMLQLDCLDKIGADLKAQIMKAMTGIQELENAGEPILLAKKEFLAEWGTMKDNVNSAKKSIKKDLFGPGAEKVTEVKNQIKQLKKELKNMEEGEDKEEKLKELNKLQSELITAKEEADKAALEEREKKNEADKKAISDAAKSSASRLTSAGKTALSDLKKLSQDFIIEIN